MRRLAPGRQRREIDLLYRLLYEVVHDLDHSADLSALQTQKAFANQWRSLPKGQYLLSDPWFRENVSRILSEEELQIRKEWFAGKEVLDAGCGNGRWSYGLAQLGANVTAVDVNKVALDETRDALEQFDVRKEFHLTPLEELSSRLGDKKYDLVLCWGVLHHCRSFTVSLDEIVARLKGDGVLYLYLYGRESIPLADDLELFKDRLRYNCLATEEERYRFLLAKAGGDSDQVHNYHDYYAPLINRRLEFEDVRRMLEERGLKDVTRTVDHTELFVRAIRGGVDEYHARWLLPKKRPPYWFEHH